MSGDFLVVSYDHVAVYTGRPHARCGSRGPSTLGYVLAPTRASRLCLAAVLKRSAARAISTHSTEFSEKRFWAPTRHFRVTFYRRQAVKSTLAWHQHCPPEQEHPLTSRGSRGSRSRWEVSWRPEYFLVLIKLTRVMRHLVRNHEVTGPAYASSPC